MLYFFIEVHMENQVNVGGQNTQQIEQNPINQPVQIPEKPKINYWTISIILLLAIILMGGVWFVLNTKSKISSNQQTTSTQEKIGSPKPTDSKSILEGKVIYKESVTGETKILDFDRKQTFSTGVKAYFGDSDLSQFMSPSRSKIILPGEVVGIFNSSSVSFLKNLLVKEAFAFLQDSKVHLFIVDLSKNQRQQIAGEFLIGSGTRFVWLDDNYFCYKEIDVMRPTYKKIWQFDLAGDKKEVTETDCPFPNPPENPITQKYILDESTYQGGYETKIKNPDTNQEIILIKPDSNCAFVPQAVLSPNGERIAFACELGKNELINKYIYILPVKDVLLGSYEKAIKIGYENYSYIQWVDDGQLLLKSAVGYKSVGEMWDTAKIVLVKLDGSQQELVSKGTRITDGPIIAPKKNAFVYETIVEGKPNKSREGNEEIILISLNKKVLYRIPGTYAKWIR